MLKFLIKKEFKEFITSFKCLLTIFLAAWVPFFYSNLHNVVFPVWVHVLLSQMVVGQFLFDSYRVDVKNGGIHFLINKKVNFILYYSVKYIFILFLVLIPICLNIKQWFTILKWYEFIWYFLSLIYCGSLMFVMQVFSKGEEIATAFIVTIIMAIILFVIYLSPIYLRFIEVIVFDVLLLVVCVKLYNSVVFRKQI